MSRNLMRMALIMAATAAYAQDDIFGCSSPRLDAPSGNIPPISRSVSQRNSMSSSSRG